MKRQPKQASLYPVKIEKSLKAENIITWGLPLAFCLHLLDEIFLNGGFVYGVQRHIWPAYDGFRFGLVNAAFFILISLNSYLYFIRPDKWFVFPLFWLWERTWNGLWHIVWALLWKEYSPGLVTSALFGSILLWILLRGLVPEQLTLRTKVFIAMAALAFEVLLILTLFILR